MNKIVVNGSYIESYNSNSLYINDNLIFFEEDSDIYIEYKLVEDANIVFRVKDNASINVFEYSNYMNHSLNVKYELGKNALINIYKFGLNDNIDENIVINLDGEGASFKYVFSSLNYHKNNYYLKINHNNKNTVSNVYNQILTFKDSCVNFTIDSILPNGSTGCYINQESRGTNLDNSQIVIKPNMIIEEEDTSAKHSSAVGKVDRNIIFYLMSRGIDESDARMLLIKGFLFQNLHFKFDLKEKMISDINNELGVIM